MAGSRRLRKIQLGLESTSGTAVAATAIWRGVATMPEDQRETVFVNEDVGLLAGTDRSYQPVYNAQLPLDPTEATFEQLPYILSAGVENIVAGAADGDGSGKIYQYDFATTAQNTIKTYTIEAGDNEGAEEMEYSFVESFSLTGAPGEAVKMSALWRGRQLAPTTFTAGISLPSVEEILFTKAKLYIDDIGTAFGTTLKSSTLLGFNLNVKTGYIPVFAATGANYFSFAKQTMPEVTLDITFEHDATSIAEKVKWRTNTARKIRLLIEGSALATAGTAYTYKTIIIDLAGKWGPFGAIEEQDGNDIVTGTFHARYNVSDAFYGQIKVVNEVATLP